jgi:hypothetical protein
LDNDWIAGGVSSWAIFGFLSFVVSALGAVPKKLTGSWRRIDNHRLSGVNAAILYACKLLFINSDMLCARICRLKRFGDVYIAKIDRQFPIRHCDYWKMGFCWRGLFYYHKRLCFGTKTAPAWFCRLSVAICWMMGRWAVHCMAYVDDFIIFGSSVGRCKRAVGLLLALLRRWGIPPNRSKFAEEGCSSTCAIILGLQYDTVCMTISIGAERLEELLALLLLWTSKQVATRREIQSLLGKLSFAAACIEPGMLF